MEGTDETALMKNVMGEGKGKRGQGKGDPEGAMVGGKKLMFAPAFVCLSQLLGCCISSQWGSVTLPLTGAKAVVMQLRRRSYSESSIFYCKSNIQGSKLGRK